MAQDASVSYRTDVGRRGMSWSGWLYNKFTKEPALHLPSSSSEISMGFICPECRVAQRSQLALMEHYDTMHAPTKTSSQDTRQPSSRRDLVPSSHDRGTTASSSERHSHTDADGLSVDQRAFLDALAPQLLEMKQASRAIGNALDHHNAQLDRLDAKSDKAKDDMRLVTAKAINLTHSSMTIDVQFRCALQEQNSRRFMTPTSHGDPVFSLDTASDTCIFRAFTLTGNGDIWGFQHEQSRRWLGLNMFGSVKVQGEALRSYEQFALDSGREWTTLYSFACAFGHGGWLCVRPDGSVYCTRRTATNKDVAMLVKVVRIEPIAERTRERANN
ncbi:hypothetical protein, variant 1 [Aphanomyces astaci]|uniref:t-SNARE coiled-coil homology domain-containing protein n=1 Tax=Aphanomyces astaci TaxID=112090 RepID=W4GJE6_APHAT|nr:hypothetical protein, variant 1 [Aphanomyces astaci]ETV79038.1 hypothetical protein, variant 1 [Aphanomyces astaci]|eukprot:XP_009831757.1 hypothetical protein, variant 1 [Aphanomyces astaci]